MRKVLVYNNQTGIAEKMEPLFAGEGLQTVTAADAEEFRALLRDREVLLMLVDVELGSKGWDKGIELIADLRRRSSIPLIVVAGQSVVTAKIMALEAGADDYVVADCNPLELLARVKSQIHRYLQLVNMYVGINHIYRVDDLVIDDVQRKVTVADRNVRLTPIEYKIVKLLVQQKGQVFSNSQIYEKIWNMRAIGAESTIAVHIRHIREKIEENPRQPRYIKLVWGNGYKAG